MDRDALRELARRIVERAAPDQLKGFDTQAQAWFDDPRRARLGDVAGNDPLTSGLATAIAGITPAAMFIASHVLSAVVDTTIAESGKGVFHLLRRSKSKGDPAVQTSTAGNPLDVAAIVTAYGGDFERIRETARAAGLACGLEPERAEAIAAAVVAVLASGRAQSPRSGDVDQVAND